MNGALTDPHGWIVECAFEEGVVVFTQSDVEMIEEMQAVCRGLVVPGDLEFFARQLRVDRTYVIEPGGSVVRIGREPQLVPAGPDPPELGPVRILFRQVLPPSTGEAKERLAVLGILQRGFHEERNTGRWREESVSVGQCEPFRESPGTNVQQGLKLFDCEVGKQRLNR
ncbi:hypothetical protein GCM10020255_095320 [Rhodococcus baikonurensis]